MIRHLARVAGASLPSETQTLSALRRPVMTNPAIEGKGGYRPAASATNADSSAKTKAKALIPFDDDEFEDF
ncbi:hypothetical protein [Desulfosoma caldarium]|uniref:Uncharacterized protein n=1 Tax=Desulfosoma caldarium TaxID=610254 RepID=A0A3N1UHG2_9BACT|nr:hypothetical protein [Desulfosoma caldarium]ROQ90694.1 hypothetical protein EDC27_2581 [Desulfosoma caldarium]